MNKWIILVATLFMSIGFSTTIKTTIANPTGSNLIVSIILGLSVVVGLWIFNKSNDKKKENDYDGFTPID